MKSEVTGLLNELDQRAWSESLADARHIETLALAVLGAVVAGLSAFATVASTRNIGVVRFFVALSPLFLFAGIGTIYIGVFLRTRLKIADKRALEAVKRLAGRHNLLLAEVIGPDALLMKSSLTYKPRDWPSLPTLVASLGSIIGVLGLVGVVLNGTR